MSRPASCRQLRRDRGVSGLDISAGKLRGRKGFLAMVEKIKTGDIAVVAAYDQSRAFRNTSDALDFYAMMEKRPDIEVAFVHGRFDRSPAGEFTYTTLAAAHAMERRMTGEKIRDAYMYATRRGQMVGQVPGGYVRNLDGSISIDEDIAPTIRRIFEMYATGRFTARDIARRFNVEDVSKLPRSRGAACTGTASPRSCATSRTVAWRSPRAVVAVGEVISSQRPGRRS